VLLSVAVLGAVVPGSASATTGLPPGVSLGGEAMSIPGFAALYGQGAQPGEGYLSDQDLVYDTSVDVLFLYSGSAPIAINVSAEQFDWGSETVYVNETVANRTVLQPEQVPVRVDVQWSNTSVTLLPKAGSYVDLPLPFAGQPKHLEVSVPGVTWELTHLTPAGSSIAGLYSTLGLGLLLLIESAVTAAVLVAALFAAKLLATKAYRTPRVRAWWPAAWIAVPVFLFFEEYIPFNQFLGSLSPYLYPVFIAAAAFPYLPRLWRNCKMGMFLSFRPKSSTEGSMPAAVLPVVERQGGLRCAPETWREVLYTLLGVPLPEVKMDTVDSAGIELKLEPKGLPASCPLDPWYDADVDVFYWFDSRKGLKRVRHRLEWTRAVQVPKFTELEDGTLKTETVTKRRFSPHIVEGYLAGSYPPVQDIAEYLAGIRSLEQESMDHEVDRLMVASLQGQIMRERRLASRELMDVAIEAIYSATKPATREELIRRVQAHARPNKERGGESHEPPGTETG
jgi:hypothetical protein